MTTSEDRGADETINALSDQAEATSPARDHGPDLKGTVAAKANVVKEKAQALRPESFDVDQAAAKARQAADAAQQNPVGLVIGAFIVGVLMGRARGRRSA